MRTSRFPTVLSLTFIATIIPALAGPGIEPRVDLSLEQTRLVVQDPETPFTLKVPAKPLEVTLNKYGEILARPVRPQ